MKKKCIHAYADLYSKEFSSLALFLLTGVIYYCIIYILFKYLDVALIHTQS